MRKTITALAIAVAFAAPAQAQTTTWELSLVGYQWLSGHLSDPFNGGPYFALLYLTTPQAYGTFDGSQVELSLFEGADFMHPVVIDGNTLPPFSVTTAPSPVVINGEPQPLPVSTGFMDAGAVQMHGAIWLNDSLGPTGPITTFVEFVGAGLEIKESPDVVDYSLHTIGYWDHVYVTNAPPVPEPASWALMLGGLAVGASVRRRRLTAQT